MFSDFAVQYHHNECVELLLNHPNINPNEHSNEGKTGGRRFVAKAKHIQALHLAVEYTNEQALQLLTNKCNSLTINPVDNHGNSPLHYALMQKTKTFTSFRMAR